MYNRSSCKKNGTVLDRFLEAKGRWQRGGSGTKIGTEQARDVWMARTPDRVPPGRRSRLHGPLGHDRTNPESPRSSNSRVTSGSVSRSNDLADLFQNLPSLILRARTPNCPILGEVEPATACRARILSSRTRIPLITSHPKVTGMLHPLLVENTSNTLKTGYRRCLHAGRYSEIDSFQTLDLMAAITL